MLKTIETHVICRRPDRYLSFPDVIRLRNGGLLCAFRDSNQHYPPDHAQTELLLTVSHDGGRTWGEIRSFTHRPAHKPLGSWHCPRFSRLRDGRLALVCDFAAVDGPEVHVSFSSDEGKTWGVPIPTGAHGIVPDRLIETSTGMLLIAAHYGRRDARRMYEFLVASEDGGRTWQPRSIIAEESYRDFCEGSIVKLPSGELLCYLRENSFLGLPTYVSSSPDDGLTWTPPEPHPTRGHRPSAGLLHDNRLLLLYRQVAGNPGLCGWLGTASERGVEVSARLLDPASVTLTDAGLRIASTGQKWSGTEYFLYALASPDDICDFSVTVRRIDGVPGSCVINCLGTLSLEQDEVVFSQLVRQERTEVSQEVWRKQLDTSVFHTFRFGYGEGVLQIFVDEDREVVLRMPANLDGRQRKISFGNASAGRPWQVKYDSAAGTSEWESFSLSLREAAGGEVKLSWHTKEGVFPDDYGRNRISQVSEERAGDLYESGYAGWVQLDEHTLYVVDYCRGAEATPYIVGHIVKLAES